MTISALWDEVLETLDALRAPLIGLVADDLTYTLPMLAIPENTFDLLGLQQRHMLTTVARLHDALQAARLNWGLISYEYEWAAQSLPRFGVTEQHQQILLESYFATALKLRSWQPHEQGALAAIQKELSRILRSSWREARFRERERVAVR